MSKRLRMGKDRILREEDGTAVGTIVEIVLDCDGWAGGKEDNSQQQTLAVGIPLEKSKISHSSQRKIEIDEVWSEYQRCFPKKRVRLDDKLKRIINRALDVREVAVCKMAVCGLSKDPWCSEHKPRPYDSIGYALSAIGNESIEERIDRMASQATITSSNSGATFSAEVKDRMRQVEAMLLNPEDQNLRARAGNARMELLNRHGLLATVENADGKNIVRWKQAPTASARV